MCSEPSAMSSNAAAMLPMAFTAQAQWMAPLKTVSAPWNLVHSLPML